MAALKLTDPNMRLPIDLAGPVPLTVRPASCSYLLAVRPAANSLINTIRARILVGPVGRVAVEEVGDKSDDGSAGRLIST